MTRKIHFLIVAVAGAISAVAPSSVVAQEKSRAEQLAEIRAQRQAVEDSLESLAIVTRKLMIPMRDGVRLATDVYVPRNRTGPVPAIFVRTPYNYNWWDLSVGAPNARLKYALDAIKRGYAYVWQNERGRYFSEGNWDILGPPTTDGSDAFRWITKQPWSNGKIGMTGCSSTAEYQMAVAAEATTEGNTGLAAVNPQSFGAGVGRVGGLYEQGNWYRGGAVQLLFAHWLWDDGNTRRRPMFPPDTPREDLVQLSKYFDLDPQQPPVDWGDVYKHLPEVDMVRYAGGAPGIFADSIPGIATGGRMIQRTPNDPAWYRGGLYHDNMVINVPGLWMMTWYDVSISPNLATFQNVIEKANPEMAKQQYAVIAPTLHCQYTRATENTIVGERSVGDARLDYDALIFGFFDNLLKGEKNGLLDTLPRVRYYTMGTNKWYTADTWPPKGAKPMTFYLSSGGKANTLNGDGALSLSIPGSGKSDAFTYDPMHPVPSHGGNVCCQGTFSGGAMDQRELERTRQDILVYSTEPLKEGIEVTGPVNVTLYTSSDRKDTDFTVKLIDVQPDGTAYNLDETILRARYRDGYDKQVWMEPGKVYKVVLGPMNTSNYFGPGHRIRIEVSSSNFPRFDRNLNTGGHNYDETESLVAKNVIHHSKQYPSHVTLSVLKH